MLPGCVNSVAYQIHQRTLYFPFFSNLPSLPCWAGRTFLSQGSLCSSWNHCRYHSIQNSKREYFFPGSLFRLKRSFPEASQELDLARTRSYTHPSATLWQGNRISKTEWDFTLESQGQKWTSKSSQGFAIEEKKRLAFGQGTHPVKCPQLFPKACFLEMVE